ncbi:MAG: bifunctional riboflavin kinase/FAD synthetase [Rhodobacteraceae bacterium]|nr:bifunctional riboflavin kinase/FAD synthetase [Paracoccaceae bacterium]
MEIFRGLSPEAPSAGPPTAVAIGNFDGVHRGHRAVIDAARRAASAQGLRFSVMTFEPHPREVFQPDAPPFRLTPEALKARKMAGLGVEALFVLPFGPDLSSLSPEAFAETVLMRRIGARHVVVGADFRFGAKRAGDVSALRVLGERFGFTVEIVEKIGDPSGVAPELSSSAARTALQDGRPVDAARILGDWHRIEGVVELGDQRGRELGYPTANLPLNGVLHPAYGVYAVKVDVLDGAHQGVYDAVASLGLRPTFEKTVANFESFLFDFSGDLYGAGLSVSLVAFLRPELKFNDIQALIDQMDQDSLDARKILAAVEAPWI